MVLIDVWLPWFFQLVHSGVEPGLRTAVLRIETLIYVGCVFEIT